MWDRRDAEEPTPFGGPVPCFRQRTKMHWRHAEDPAAGLPRTRPPHRGRLCFRQGTGTLLGLCWRPCRMKISHAPQRITPCWKGRTLQHEPCGTCETLAGRAEPWGRTALMPPGRGGPLQQGAKPAHAGKGWSLPILARGEACPFRQGVNPAHSGKGAASRTEVHPFQQGGLREVHPFQLPSPADPARRSTPSSKVFSTVLPEGDAQRGPLGPMPGLQEGGSEWARPRASRSRRPTARRGAVGFRAGGPAAAVCNVVQWYRAMARL